MWCLYSIYHVYYMYISCRGIAFLLARRRVQDRDLHWNFRSEKSFKRLSLDFQKRTFKTCLWVPLSSRNNSQYCKGVRKATMNFFIKKKTISRCNPTCSWIWHAGFFLNFNTKKNLSVLESSSFVLSLKSCLNVHSDLVSDSVWAEFSGGDADRL